ncbi:hypothetical protein BGZ58_004995, partial [Dissophora ornata]
VNPDIDSALGLSLTILSSMLVLIIVITAGIVIYNRENIIIKSARVDVPTEATCKVGATITVIGFTINLSAIVVKNYRIYRIFNSVSVINHAVSNQYLLRVTAIPVILTTIPCIIRSCIYRLEPEIIQTSNDEYPGSGRTQLTWHETFTYTCLQVMAESYRALVLDAMEIPDATQRNQTLSNIMHGNRSQDLTLKSIGSMAFNTPIGTFSINQDGDPLP